MSNSPARGAKTSRQPSTPAVGFVGEVDAHEEDAFVGIAELLAVEDVAAAVGDGARHGKHDSATVGAGQGQDQLALAHAESPRVA